MHDKAADIYSEIADETGEGSYLTGFASQVMCSADEARNLFAAMLLADKP